jgi:putative addiction module killer protein
MRQCMQNSERIIQIYQTARGQTPFEGWIEALSDKKAKAIVFQRIDRVRLGNFGDCRSLGSGIYELRIFWGPGYRVYYGLEDSKIVLLLCGGNKSSQKKDIARASQMWKEFKRYAS